MRRLALLALGLSSILPVEAQACIAPRNFAVIHSALPEPLPDGLFVAEVEIETDDQWAIYSTGLRAHVKKMIVGGPIGEVVLRLPEATSCDAPFANGRSGLLVGLAKERAGDDLIVWPLLVSRYDGFRLPNDFKLHTGQPTGPTASPQRE